VVDPETGEVIAEYNDEVTEKLLNTFKERKVEAFEILFIDNINVSSSFRDTLVMDKIELSREEREKLPTSEPGKSIREKESERALIDIYKRLRREIRRPLKQRWPLLQPLLQCGTLRPLQSGTDEAEPQTGPERNSSQDPGLHRTVEKRSIGRRGERCGRKRADRSCPGRMARFRRSHCHPGDDEEIQRVSKILYPIG